MPVCQAVVY
ncbi:hypothetical protein F383_24411 [Gossypium arboreum]|uniref:Uncharacterized protein n=1 Tax=Gossypium arboreum TaxID=29729 RepID=A0A0B0P687_GOSAR|nr:hypothetical protein F383_24411 [Gossypium arboreum]